VSQQRTDASGPQAQAEPPRTEAMSCADPAELARRRLVEWCVRHDLPVPVEKPAANQPRR
jgi:hypothetical protein